LYYNLPISEYGETLRVIGYTLRDYGYEVDVKKRNGAYAISIGSAHRAYYFSHFVLNLETGVITQTWFDTDLPPGSPERERVAAVYTPGSSQYRAGLEKMVEQFYNLRDSLTFQAVNRGTYSPQLVLVRRYLEAVKGLL